jgi:hypothetical protein
MEDYPMTPQEVLELFNERGIHILSFYHFCEDAGFVLGEEGGETHVSSVDVEEWLEQL